MRTLTKSPLAFARTALQAGERTLPRYSHPSSPHQYTQPQLFAILALKDFFGIDYRGIVKLVSEWSDLRQVLGLERVPDYSTLRYAEKRLLKKGASLGSLRPPSTRPGG